MQVKEMLIAFTTGWSLEYIRNMSKADAERFAMFSGLYIKTTQSKGLEI